MVRKTINSGFIIFFDGWGDFRIKYIIGASQEKASICGVLFEFAYLSLNPHFFEDL